MGRYPTFWTALPHRLPTTRLCSVCDNSSLTLKGAIVNGGAIDLASVSHPANLQISGSVTLNGGGEVILSGKQAVIGGTGSGASLTNVNDTILGAGSIGSSMTSLSNAGTIEATLGALTINTGSNAISNTGTLASIGGDLKIGSAVTGTGLDQISAGGTLEFDASVSSGQTVSFASSGTLKLGDAPQFAGAITGQNGAKLTQQDVIDLADLSYVKGKMNETAVYNSATKTTLLTVSNGASSVALTLDGNYSTSTWTLSNDGSGGTDVVDPPASSSASSSPVAAAQTDAGDGLQPVQRRAWRKRDARVPAGQLRRQQFPCREPGRPRSACASRPAYGRKLCASRRRPWRRRCATARSGRNAARGQPTQSAPRLAAADESARHMSGRFLVATAQIIARAPCPEHAALWRASPVLRKLKPRTTRDGHG